MRLVGYIRVSRVAGREGESFISPDVQRSTVQQQAAAAGHSVVRWIEDLDQPGSRNDRPGLLEALALVEAGDADGIAVAKLDRFARSVAGAAAALKRLEDADGVLVAVDLGMDTSTPAGKLMRNVLMALAEFELDRIRENWREADTRAIRRGVHVSARVPIGYLRGADGRLQPDPVAAPVIAELFELRAKGATWLELCRLLDERIPRPAGSWPSSTVSSIVRRRVYLGEAHHGDVVNSQAHEPLVDRQTWEQAQAAYPRPPKRGGNALLAGVIRCAACGYPMIRQGDGRRGYSNYRCRGRSAAGRCPEPARISERRADEFVTAAFLSWARRNVSPAHDRELTVETERAVAALERAEAELAAYRDGNLVSVIGQRAYLDGLELRARRVDDARVALRERQRAQVPLLGRMELAQEWPRLDEDERRALIAAGVDAVFVRRAHLPGRSPFEDRLWICWAGEAPPDLPGRRHSRLAPFVFPVERPGAVGVTPTEKIEPCLLDAAAGETGHSVLTAGEARRHAPVMRLLADGVRLSIQLRSSMQVRGVLLGVATALAVVAAAGTASGASEARARLSAPPSGFYESRVLEPAASYVAGKPVTVYCATDFQSWWAATASVFGVGRFAEAYSEIGGTRSYYTAGFFCPTLVAAAQGKKPTNGNLAGYLLTLVHESIHLRGERDEAHTECEAIHEMPRVAVRFFHVRAGKALRALMADAWTRHDAKSAAYTSEC